MIRQPTLLILALATLGGSVMGLSACGPSQPETVKANVVAGAMPANGSWRGVYYSQTFGYLHLLADGSSVSGKWRTASGEKWGEMHGTSDGDLLRYEWEETRIGMFGPNAKSHGKGYFKYVVPEGDDPDHEIHGQWGLGDNEAGYTWDAVKQRRMEPDPNSVMPDETATAVEGGDWDGSKSKNASGVKDDKPSDRAPAEGSDKDKGDGWE
ncbi:MAG TPA: hypothetical protein VHM70_24090 [Polyangiaceae bacterium]|jgi:hypothetical protein|nr:hypothetical protein [Polyangiaceae bacterium]